MTIYTSLAFVVLCMFTFSQLSQKSSMASSNHGKILRKYERQHAIREVAHVVRSAWDLGSATAGNPGVNACPSQTRRITYQGNLLCWPLQANSTCIQTSKAVVCPVLTGGNPTAGLENIMKGLHFDLSPIPSALASSSVGTIFMNVTPEPSAATGGGVRLVRPSCVGPIAACIRCDSPDTTCLTMAFCIDNTADTNCSASKRVLQTFAFRE